MIPEAGLLVINRNPESVWRHLPENERAPIIRYRGFDGRDKWPLLELNTSIALNQEMAPIHEIQNVLDYYSLAKRKYGQDVDLLLVAPRESTIRLENFSFVGFDAGLISEDEEPVYFSAILNEVRENGNAAIRDLAMRLNRYYLFAHQEDAEICLERRRKAIKSAQRQYLETAYADVNDVVRIDLYVDNSEPENIG